MTIKALENELRIERKKYTELSKAYDRLKKQYYDLDDMYIRNDNLLQLLAKRKLTDLFTDCTKKDRYSK